MDLGRWQQVKRTFLEVLERSPEEREGYLSSICAEDSALRSRVETLLRSDHLAGDFLESPVLEWRESPPCPQLGAEGSIGNYRIVRELGRGGMGVVYLAERIDDEYHNKVALKVLNAGWLNASLRRRFQAEGRILSCLEHPNIARMLGGGTTDDRLPYLVLEYVEGVRIDEFCQANALTCRDRLELLLPVCEALHFAHRNLVVHRDIKPSNILVTPGGVPKLLDFGIAKLLAADPDDSMTATGLSPMTPEYAAPEQVRREAITTATDVYGLGAVLYKLMTGRAPYPVGPAGYEDLLRAICTVEPLRPSLVMHRPVPPAASRVDDAERIQPSRQDRGTRRLRGGLGADLDAIVLMAMAKEPGDRYASVDHLAEDLRRVIKGAAILARKDSVFYRASKLVRRHWLASLAVGVLLAMGVGWALSVAKQREEVLRERQRAEHVTAFLIGMFEAVEPTSSGASPITAREVLDQGRVRVREDLSGQPEIQASLMTTMGTLYRHIGLPDLAEGLLQEALAVHRGLAGEPGSDYAETLDQLGRALQSKGENAAAIELHREALQVRRDAGEDALSVAESLNALGSAHWRRGEHAAAEDLLREVLAVALENPGDDGLAPAEASLNLSMLLVTTGAYDEADRLATQALEVISQALGGGHPDVARGLEHMGRVRHAQGRYEEAELAFRQALRIQRSLYGAKHPQVVKTLNSLAVNSEDRGDPSSAEALFREAVELASRIFGDNHPEVLVLNGNLGMLLASEGQLEEASLRLAGAVDRARAIRADPPLMSTLVNNLAVVLDQQGKHRAAGDLHLEALQLRRQVYGAEHLKVANSLNNLASCLRLQGRLDEAEQRSREALALLRRIFGEKHRYVALVAANLARIYRQGGNDAQAETWIRRALAMERELLGPEHPQTARSETLLAEILLSRSEQDSLAAGAEGK